MTIHAAAGNMYGLPPIDPTEARAAMAKIHAREAALQRHAEMFAGKWFADEHAEEPTDEALRVAFERCVLPPKPERYPAIRAAILNYSR